MFIEIDTRCNARCFYCDTGNQSRDAHRKWMSVDRFEGVLDHALKIEMIDEDSLIYLFDRGEPTLHPEISAIIRALDARRLEYSISTNCGMAPRLDDQVSLRGLRKFVISMPGWSQASYDRIHQLPFKKVVDNIEFMLGDFRRRGFEGEAVMSLHVYRFNTNELAPASEFCDRHGIVFAPYFAYFADTTWLLDFLEGRLSDNVLTRAKEELFLDKIMEESRNTPKDFRCLQYDRVTINEVGELVLCCGAPRPGNGYYDGYLLGDFTSMTADQAMQLKTTSPACKRCVASGAAYLGHVTMRPDEFFPAQKPRDVTSRLEVYGVPLAKPAAPQWAAAENASLQDDGGGLQLMADSAYGYHRLLGWIEAGQPGKKATVSVSVKSAGCSLLKLEIHDIGAKNYAAAQFDLKSGFQFGSTQGRISSEGNGYYRLSLDIVPASTRVHYTISLMNFDNSIVYVGRSGKTVQIRDIDMPAVA